jgi:RNA polymerase sigma factor (sigma-70 family)
LELANGKIMDPAEILASRAILEKIDAACRRCFSAENDRDECYVFVLDSLRADDFKRLRAFEGKSKFTTYLYTLINSLVVDFKRKKYGRRRMPAAVLKLGRWAEAVYRLVCWQKFSYDDAYDFLRIDGLFEGNYAEFMQAVEPIQNAPCRENPTFKPLGTLGGESLKSVDAIGANALEDLIQKLDEQKRMKALKIIRETTKRLPEKDQLLVRLVYGSEHSARAAAKIINLSASAARKKLKAILINYRRNLLAAGIREP